MAHKTYICKVCDHNFPCIITIHDRTLGQVIQPSQCITTDDDDDDDDDDRNTQSRWVLQHEDKPIITKQKVITPSGINIKSMKLPHEHTDEIINNYLQAKMKESNTFVLKATCTRYYVVNSSTYKDDKDTLIKEWFIDTPTSACHASRDYSLYYTTIDEVVEIEKEDGEINVMALV